MVSSSRLGGTHLLSIERHDEEKMSVGTLKNFGKISAGLKFERKIFGVRSSHGTETKSDSFNGTGESVGLHQRYDRKKPKTTTSIHDVFSQVEKKAL